MCWTELEDGEVGGGEVPTAAMVVRVRIDLEACDRWSRFGSQVENGLSKRNKYG